MITQTPEFIDAAIQNPTRVDFDLSRYETIIAQKGREVLLEKSLACPCKTKSSASMSSCRNCGGSGWIFTTGRITRMIIQGIKLITDYKAWSEENRGMVNVSCSATEEIAFMDKITILNATSTFAEVIHLDGSGQGENIVNLAYIPTTIDFVGKFVNQNSPILPLTVNVDYTISGNNFTLLSSVNDSNVHITLRYKHAPVFYIIDLTRESMNTFVLEGGKEKVSNMPLSAIAKKAHYVLNLENVAGNRLVQNPWPTPALIC